jgi:hypothetical protein
VNRLKMLKRQMYGQASVELLRARVMPLALHTCQQTKVRRSRFECSKLAFELEIRDLTAARHRG